MTLDVGNFYHSIDPGFFVDPRFRCGSCDGGVLLLALSIPNFPRSRLMITTSRSIIARSCGEMDVSSRSVLSTFFKAEVTSIFPMLTIPPSH